MGEVGDPETADMASTGHGEYYQRVHGILAYGISTDKLDIVRMRVTLTKTSAFMEYWGRA